MADEIEPTENNQPPGAAPTSPSQQLTSAIGKTERNREMIDVLIESFPALRLVGYLLLAVEVVDFATLAMGMELMNPQWEWRTFGIVAQERISP